jgi:hypothetical protein
MTDSVMEDEMELRILTRMILRPRSMAANASFLLLVREVTHGTV